jgi:hypothetical protein
MLTQLSKGVQTKYFNCSDKRLFSICHWCHRHLWCTWSCEYLRKFLKKFETALFDYYGAWGKLNHEKTWSRKSRGTVP